MAKENPVQKLSPIIIRLFELSNDTRFHKNKRNAFFNAAFRLNNCSFILVKEQFEGNSDAYKEAMKEIKAVNKGLKDAKDDIEEISTSLENLSKFVESVEKLVSAISGI